MSLQEDGLKDIPTDQRQAFENFVYIFISAYCSEPVYRSDLLPPIKKMEEDLLAWQRNKKQEMFHFLKELGTFDLHVNNLKRLTGELKIL